MRRKFRVRTRTIIRSERRRAGADRAEEGKNTIEKTTSAGVLAAGRVRERSELFANAVRPAVSRLGAYLFVALAPRDLFRRRRLLFYF